MRRWDSAGTICAGAPAVPAVPGLRHVAKGGCAIGLRDNLHVSCALPAADDRRNSGGMLLSCIHAGAQEGCRTAPTSGRRAAGRHAQPPSLHPVAGVAHVLMLRALAMQASMEGVVWHRRSEQAVNELRYAANRQHIPPQRTTLSSPLRTFICLRNSHSTSELVFVHLGHVFSDTRRHLLVNLSWPFSSAEH